MFKLLARKMLGDDFKMFGIIVLYNFESIPCLKSSTFGGLKEANVATSFNLFGADGMVFIDLKVSEENCCTKVKYSVKL